MSNSDERLIPITEFQSDGYAQVIKENGSDPKSLVSFMSQFDQGEGHDEDARTNGYESRERLERMHGVALYDVIHEDQPYVLFMDKTNADMALYRTPVED